MNFNSIALVPFLSFPLPSSVTYVAYRFIFMRLFVISLPSVFSSCTSSFTSFFLLVPVLLLLRPCQPSFTSLFSSSPPPFRMAFLRVTVELPRHATYYLIELLVLYQFPSNCPLREHKGRGAISEKCSFLSCLSSLQLLIHSHASNRWGEKKKRKRSARVLSVGGMVQLMSPRRAPVVIEACEDAL